MKISLTDAAVEHEVDTLGMPDGPGLATGKRRLVEPERHVAALERSSQFVSREQTFGAR